jgi:UDP-N-acetyl-D-galactosamine dehydrogenase
MNAIRVAGTLRPVATIFVFEEWMMKHSRLVSVIGLGYVGLPVAIAFGQKARTIGFDISSRRIEELKAGIDRNGEVSAEVLRSADIFYTSNLENLRQADFHTHRRAHSGR